MAKKSTMRKRILMLSAPASVQSGLPEGLEKEGISYSLASSISDARQDLAKNGLPDGMFINLQGFEADGPSAEEMTLYAGLPVIVLGANGSDEQVALQALACADGYLRSNEVDSAELVARLERVFSRISSFVYGLGRKIQLARNIVVDLIDGIVSIGENNISLTPTEIALLHVLLTHDNEVVDSTTLMDRVWRGASERQSKFLASSHASSPQEAELE